MSKKDFKNNPVLQFISDDQTETQTESKHETNKGTYKGKSETLEQRLAELRELLPEGKSLAIKTEPRSKRLQVVLTPTLYRHIKAAAESKGISVNEYVNRTLEAKIESED